jgi:hypothetical protein
MLITWREALEASIVNWERRADGEWVSENCPLCVKKTPQRDCGGTCPIATPSTEGRFCIEEYQRWYEFRSKDNAKAVLNVLIKARNHPKCRIRTKGKKK